jgi:hypothetical protein
MSSTSITATIGFITFTVTEDESWKAKQAYERMKEWATVEVTR